MTQPVSAAPKRRRWLKILGIALVFVVLGLGVLVAFAPAIASGFVPGIAKSAAKGAIAGELSIDSASLSWGGPQRLTGVQLKDPMGAVVAQVNAEAAVGLWSLIRGSKDLGDVKLSGKVDLVKAADGSTNLQQATAGPPGAAAPAKPTSSAPVTLPGGLGAHLVLDGVDIRYKEVDGSGKPVSESSITGLRGDASVSTIGVALAKADFSAAVGDGKTSGSLKVSIKLENFADAQGRLTLASTKGDATIDAGNIPIALVDALANLNGLLLEAIGPDASANIVGKGDASSGVATIGVVSQNLTADLSLKLENGKLVSEKPGSVSLRSSRFLAKLPALKAALDGAGVSVETWPAVDAKVTALTLPIPQAGAGGGGGGVGGGQPDLRGLALDVEVKTTAVAGRLTQPAKPAVAATATTPAQAASPARTQAFALAPAALTIKAPDLAQGVALAGSAFATLDQQSAGALTIDIKASGLLDKDGRLALRGGLPGRLSGSLGAKGVSTTLAQPFLTNQPIDLLSDVGPTLDVLAKFDTPPADVAGGPVTLDVDASVDSRNIKVRAPLHLVGPATGAAAGGATAGGELSGRGDTTIEIVSAGGLIRRVLAKGEDGGAPAPIRVAGEGGVKLTVSELRVPLPGLPKAGTPAPAFDFLGVTATARAQLSRLEVSVRDAQGGPVAISDAILTARQRPGKPAEVSVQGTMSHEGKPFAFESTLSVTGLDKALASKEPGAFIPGVGPLRAAGTIRLNNAPLSLSRLAPSKPSAPIGPGKAPEASVLSELFAGVLGDAATLAVNLEPGKDGQDFSAQVSGGALSVETSGGLSAAAARVQAFSAVASVRPETVRALMKAAGQDKGDLGAVAMRGPARVQLTLEPLEIPLSMKSGAPQADWARAGLARATVTVNEPLVVSGIPLQKASAGVPAKTLTGGVRDLKATATVPLAMLGGGGPVGGPSAGPAGGDPLLAQIRAKLLLDEGRQVGDLLVNATIPRDFASVDASASITGLSTSAVDGVISQPGLVSGALGDTADISVTMRQDLKTAPAGGEAQAPIRAKVQVSKSPRLTTDPLDVLMDRERIALLAPAKITWTIDPAWADRFLLAPKEAGQAQAFRFVGPTTFAVDIRKLSIGQSDVRGGLVASGPLKPGVFALDLSASAPRVQIQQMVPPGQQGPGGAPAPVTLEALTAEVKSGQAGELTIDIKAGSVAGGGVASSAPVTLKGALRDIAAANGEFNSEGFAADINLQAESAPTALIDAAAGMNGRLTELLGPQLKAAVTTTNFTRRPGGRGEIDINVRSFRPTAPEPAALFALAAPVADGVISTGQAKPMRLELAEFSIGEQSPLVQSLGIIAAMSKQRLDAQGKPDPVRISSANLRLPLGTRRGELRQLNGDIEVNMGVINYQLRTGFASLIKTSQLREFTRSAQQPAMKPFRVTIRQGVAEYQDVEIPLRIGLGLGEEVVEIPLSGKVDLVDQQIDVEASLPFALVSGTVLSVLPVGFSGLQNDVLDILTGKSARNADDPKVQERANKLKTLRVPVRVHGPMSKPEFDVDIELFGQRAGGMTDPLGNPLDAIKDIGEGLRDLFKKPKPKP